MADKKKASQDNFYKKVSSSKGFAVQSKVESYSTIIQMIKSDLFLLQDMINENSSEIKMHKLLSKVPALTKKLSEIEDSQELKSQTDQITEESGNIERLGKIYGCKNANELSQKLALELNFYELFVKKLSDYFLLIQLKHCSKTFQDTLSRILPVKTVMENLIQKIKISEESSSMSNVGNSNDNGSNSGNSINDNPKIKEYDHLIQLSTFNEVIDSKGENGTLFKHIHSLVNDYFNNLNQNTENMFKRLAITGKNIASSSNTPIEHFFDNQKVIDESLTKSKEDLNMLYMTNEGNVIKLKLQLEDESNQRLSDLKKKYDDELNNQYEKIKQLQLELNNNSSNKVTEEILSKNDDLIKEINDIKNKYNKEKESSISNHNNELNKLKQEIQSISDTLNKEKEKNKTIEQENDKLRKTIEQIEKNKTNISNSTNANIKNNSNNDQVVNQSTVNEVLELIQSRNKEFETFKRESRTKYESEIATLTAKFNKINEMHSIITNENRDLKKKLDLIQNKQFNADSYEQVLLSQFETMKNAFTKKVADLTDELSESKNESRVKLYELQEELKEVNKLKDIFLKQVLQLQKHFNVN